MTYKQSDSCFLQLRLAREAGLEYVEIQNLTEFYDDNRYLNFLNFTFIRTDGAFSFAYLKEAETSESFNVMFFTSIFGVCWAVYLLYFYWMLKEHNLQAC